MSISLQFFGSPHIERDGRPVTTDTRKAVALLAYLAVTRDHHARETLAALLWPEMDDERARAALRRTLSAVRTLIGEEAIDANRETAALADVPSLWADVWAFEDAVADVERHHRSGDTVCEGCLQSLSEAVALYRDDFLQGFSLRDSAEFDDWQLAQAERLRRLLASALNQLVQGQSESGQFDEAIGFARRWLAIDPLREDAHRWLMQLYAWNGARDLALRQYRDAVRVLEAELGVEPLPETTALYEAIQEGRLAAPAIATARTPLDNAIMSPAVPPVPAPLSPPRPVPLIGRDDTWAALAETYAGIGPSGQVAMIVGEAGIGKSRLAEAFLDEAQRKGATTVPVAWYEGEANLAYAPFAAALRALAGDPRRQARLADLPPAWLAEASRLAPELQSLTGLAALPADVSGPGAQSRFFAAVSEVLCALLAGPAPGVLFLDDVQWADEASLELLAYLARRLRELPIYLILAWTDDAVGSDHRLRRLVAETQRAGNGRLIELARWQPTDVAALVAADERARSLPPDVGERLYRETEGLPFFVVEYLNALSTHALDDWTMPQTVRDLLAGRLATVDETGRQLLQTAAVIGRSFDYTTLWTASGRSEDEVVAGLDRLLNHGLIRETPGSDGRDLRYDFSHQQLRSAVYDDIHLARRRLLHRRVAGALSAEARGTAAGAVASQIGYHARLAGQDDVAAEQYRLAGEFARSLFANREALDHFETALALGHPDTAALQEAIGDLHTLLGQYNAALHAYEAAAAQVEGPAPARLEHKLGQVYERRGDWELADSHLCAALASSSAIDGPAARVLVDRSRVAYRAGDVAAATALAAEALTLARESDDRLAEALAENALGILARQRGDLDEAHRQLARSLALSEASGTEMARVAALNNLAHLAGESDDTITALDLIEQALTLCRAQGDRHHEAALLNHRADLLHQAGQEEQAMNSLKESVAIYAEIGLEAGGWQPEIWKLTEW